MQFSVMNDTVGNQLKNKNKLLVIGGLVNLKTQIKIKIYKKDTPQVTNKSLRLLCSGI